MQSSVTDTLPMKLWTSKKEMNTFDLGREARAENNCDIMQKTLIKASGVKNSEYNN